MSWRGPQEEVEVVVEEKLKRIFNSLDRRYGERKGFVRRSDAIKALVLVLGPEDEPDDDEMVMICPQSWRSEELSYEQFRDIIHVAGALGALRKIDNNHLERSWASLSDPESSYTVEFPIQSKDELQPASGSKGFTDRIQRFQADGGKLKDLVYEMILSHDSGPPKGKKRQSEDEESTRPAAVVNEQLEGTDTCEIQQPDASSRLENPEVQSGMPQEDSSQTTTPAETQSYQDLSGPLKVWNVAKSLVAGGLAGVVAKTTIAPLDRTKIIFQTTEKQFSLPAASEEIQRIVREEGVRGLWRGHTATIARVMPYAGIQFVSFDAYKALLLADGEKTLTPVNRLLAGSMAGATSVFCTYPLDLMRARMSVQHTNYGGMHHNFRTVLRADGAAGLYRGLVPTLVGILPYAGLAFGTFETLKIMVSQHFGTETVNGQQRFYCGVIAGFVAQSLTYPLDIVRRRMQTDGAHMLPGQTAPNARQYHSILQTLRHVSTREGVVGGLYKGLTMNWIKGPIAHGISFTTFDFLKRNFDVKQRVSK